MRSNPPNQALEGSLLKFCKEVADDESADASYGPDVRNEEEGQ
jgi:hypothetical protein